MATDPRVSELLEQFSHLPRFPDGRINYTNAKKAVVLTCFVMFHDTFLLLKRSNNVLTYKGKWQVVAGYVDEPKPIKDKALEEVNEETGIDRSFISSVSVGELVEFSDETAKRAWIVFPVLMKLNKQPHVRLDEEHVDYRWITAHDIEDFDTVSRFAEIFKHALLLNR